MVVFAAAKAGLVWVLVGALCLHSTPGVGQPSGIEASEACADFAPGGYVGSSWTFEECIHVWENFTATLPSFFLHRLPHVDLWKDTGAELRRAGSPCLVASDPIFDGTGSTTIRHLATWIYSKQMGCDWVTPDWGKRHVSEGNGTAVAVANCHRVATKQEMANRKPMDLSKTADAALAENRCAVVDWLSYFQFDMPSVNLPENGTVFVEVSMRAFMWTA